MNPAIRQSIEEIVGPRGCLHAAADLALYEYDGGVDKARPDIVALPRSTAEVAALVRLANQHGIPVVGRGAGTGLSGGSLPPAGGNKASLSPKKRKPGNDSDKQRA